MSKDKDDALLQFAADLSRSKLEIDKLRRALGFARSCILSGENWSRTCDKMINEPLGLPPEHWTDNPR